MPLLGLGDYRDLVWWAIGGDALEYTFNALSPTMKFGYAGGGSPRQIGVPVAMTPDKKFSQGGVIGIPFYLPGGKGNAANITFVQSSIAGTKITNEIVGIVKDPRPNAMQDIYLVLVSQDTSWISLTKIQNLFTRFREAVGNGAISVGGAISDAANQGWNMLPAWLRWIFEHPGTTAAIAIGVYLLPNVLATLTQTKRAYKEFKQA